MDPSTGKGDLLLNLDDEKSAVCSLTPLSDRRFPTADSRSAWEMAR
jgi:hypothetical protein